MTSETSPDPNIVGCVLAGGLSRRMGGGDKPLKRLGGKTMLAAVLARIDRQCVKTIINANGDPGRYEGFGRPIVPDAIEGFAGPLAGISACLNWTADNLPNATHIVTVAADTPFFPDDLVDRLSSAVSSQTGAIGMATSGGHRHPVFGIWPLSLRHHLAQWMLSTDTYKVIAWARLHALTMVEFPLIATTRQDIDPFFNVNSPADLLTAETLHQQIGFANPDINET